jgi:hypothetical protein
MKVKAKIAPPPRKASAIVPRRFNGDSGVIAADVTISVMTLRVEVPGVLPLGVTEAGATLQLAN